MNSPPAMTGSCGDRDPNAGNLIYLFGGANLDLGNFYSAVWVLNITGPFATTSGSIRWSWISGSSIPNPSNSADAPSARFGCGMTAVAVVSSSNVFFSSTSCSLLFMFGGYGFYDSYGKSSLNDLWYFNARTYSWTYLDGLKTGYTLCTTDNPLSPCGRYNFAWWTSAFALFLFGGTSSEDYNVVNASLNDVWKYDLISDTLQWSRISLSIT